MGTSDESAGATSRLARLASKGCRAHYVIAITAVTVFAALKKAGLYQPSALSVVALGMLLVVAWPLRYECLSRSFSILLRATVGTLGLYSLLGYIPLSDSYLAVGEYTRWLAVLGRWVAVAGTLAAVFWRPAFAWLPLLYVPWQKEILAQAAGFPLSKTDYWALLEVGSLLLLGATIAYWFARSVFGDGALKRLEQRSEGRDYWSYSQLVVLVAVSVHLSNYLYSGLTKVAIGETPWDWVLNNDTRNIVLAAELARTMPLSAYPWLLDLLHEAMSHQYLVVLANAVILVGQLLAVVAVARVSWIIGSTLFYDLTHLLIFLATGIFFWKWVLLNGAITAAMVVTRGKHIPRHWALGLGVLMAAAPACFFVARLGWFDTRSVVLTQLEAVTDDGESYVVPTNYFLPYSVTPAQQRMGLRDGTDSFPGHFKIGSFGSTRSLRDRTAADSCMLPYDSSISLSTSAYVRGLTPFIGSYHRYVIDHIDEDGHFSYDTYPHHVWSNPADFRSFQRLDKRRISTYRFVVSSTCFGYADGKVVKQVMHSSSYDIGLR